MSDYLGMSDEDFLKKNAPDAAPVEGAASPVAEPIQTETPTPEVVEQTPQETEPTQEEKTATPAQTQEEVEPATTVVTETEPKTEAVPVAGDPTKQSQTQPKTEAAPEGEQKPAATPDYEAFYKQIMAPFKANGKPIELKSPQEAIQLMQMGANYTRKMQDIAPHRKVLMMLENNGLLDEGKLSFLIDIEKKNPEAIKKLIKDSGIDPLEIDTTTEPKYQSGNHGVTDQEVTFRSALDDLKSTETGAQTLHLIHTGWDQASKEEVFRAPEIMKVIHEQRENGIYDRIQTELTRQKTLGAIRPETPFLVAYKAVGEQLAAAGAFADLITPVVSAPPVVNPPTVVTTRVAAPKSAPSNPKVEAAAPTRASQHKASVVVNPLAMSDDDFLKQMQNRL